MIKEIPILYSTPMVLALLDKRKTMTRRTTDLDVINANPGDWQFEWAEPMRNVWTFTQKSTVNEQTLQDRTFNQVQLKCPYGRPCDVFYVREEHYRYGAWIEKEGEYTKGGRQKWMFVAHTDEVLYEPHAEFRKGRHHKDPYTAAWHKRLARFMPKSSARIWLHKTATKVERACDISREDAIAEGLACISKDGGRTYKYGIPDSDGLPGNDDYGWHWQEWEVYPVAAFKKLWCKINGPETWESWVWVESFNILSVTGKPDLQNLKAIV
jgi:hypothetical protein